MITDEEMADLRRDRARCPQVPAEVVAQRLEIVAHEYVARAAWFQSRAAAVRAIAAEQVSP